MTSKERILATFKHEQADKLPVDFGATPVTGIHVFVVEKLREYFGLEKKPVKVIETYQMLGEIDDELLNYLGVDVIGLSPRNDMFGIPRDSWKPFKTFWGQEVLVPENFNTTINQNGDLLIYPEGDMTVSPSGRMPHSGFFFDAIVRQDPIDESNLNPENNLEDFGYLTDPEIEYWKQNLLKIKNSDKAVIANFGGTALGDIALVPAPFLKHPRGIRDIAEWYMSTMMRQDYLHQIFEKQTDIALVNLEKIYTIGGDHVDAIYLCGTDFGTQDSQFCSPEVFDELYAPYYRKLNNWIHRHTNSKIFKHSCGAIDPLLPNMIEAGFDIINPVQINALGMDPLKLKEKYGDRITFWGGGIDTQKVLSFGTPNDVEKQVIELVQIFYKSGGFVFNTVHNIQANVPIENVISLVETIRKIRG